MTMISRPRTRSVYTKLVFEKGEEEEEEEKEKEDGIGDIQTHRWEMLANRRIIASCSFRYPLTRSSSALDDLRRPIASALSRKFISPG